VKTQEKTSSRNRRKELASPGLGAKDLSIGSDRPATRARRCRSIGEMGFLTAAADRHRASHPVRSLRVRGEIPFCAWSLGLRKRTGDRGRRAQSKRKVRSAATRPWKGYSEERSSPRMIRRLKKKKGGEEEKASDGMADGEQQNDAVQQSDARHGVNRLVDPTQQHGDGGEGTTAGAELSG